MLLPPDLRDWLPERLNVPAEITRRQARKAKLEIAQREKRREEGNQREAARRNRRAISLRIKRNTTSNGYSVWFSRRVCLAKAGSLSRRRNKPEKQSEKSEKIGHTVGDTATADWIRTIGCFVRKNEKY